MAYLNMTDSSETCPSAWATINTPVRACGRQPSNDSGSCNSVFYSTNRLSYTHVLMDTSMVLQMHSDLFCLTVLALIPGMLMEYPGCMVHQAPGHMCGLLPMHNTNLVIQDFVLDVPVCSQTLLRGCLLYHPL